MADSDPTTHYFRTDISEIHAQKINDLARELIAREQINDTEYEHLFDWLISPEKIIKHPIISIIFDRLISMITLPSDIDDEHAEIISTLNSLLGEEFNVEEILYPRSLPLCTPPPNVTFKNQYFTFIGPFSFGPHLDCESAVIALGADAGSWSSDTTCLVIGQYITDSWEQSVFGKKIAHAAEVRSSGNTLSIISENHWIDYL